MKNQTTFFPDFLSGYEEKYDFRGDINEEEFIGICRVITSILNTFFREFCDKIGVTDFQEVQIEFFHGEIEVEILGNKKRITETLSHQSGDRLNTIFVNLEKLDAILKNFGTASGIIFLIMHEFAHGIQNQFRPLDRKSCNIEYHANYTAGYLLKAISKMDILDFDINEIYRLVENIGYIYDLQGAIGIKKDKTHFNGLEGKRSIKEGFTSSTNDFLNTFELFPREGVQVRPYQERKTNYTGPDFYNF